MLKNQPYEIAYQQALTQLNKMNLDDAAFNSSVKLENEGFSFEWLGEAVRIENKGQRIIYLKTVQEPKIAEKIILLHYLITADGSPLTRQEITFENIPGAGFYGPTFNARTRNQLLRVFKNNLERFAQIIVSFSGRVEGVFEPGKSPQVRIKIMAFPCVPISFIYWRGNQEMEPEGTASSEPEVTAFSEPDLQIVYDAGITHYLPLEDIVILTELLAHKIIKMA
ncbi:MAG: DUF3786 domain-containing protein [Planctomycetota bacterium]